MRLHICCTRSAGAGHTTLQGLCSLQRSIGVPFKAQWSPIVSSQCRLLPAFTLRQAQPHRAQHLVPE